MNEVYVWQWVAKHIITDVPPETTEFLTEEEVAELRYNCKGLVRYKKIEETKRQRTADEIERHKPKIYEYRYVVNCPEASLCYVTTAHYTEEEAAAALEENFADGYLGTVFQQIESTWRVRK